MFKVICKLWKSSILMMSIISGHDMFEKMEKTILNQAKHINGFDSLKYHNFSYMLTRYAFVLGPCQKIPSTIAELRLFELLLKSWYNFGEKLAYCLYHCQYHLGECSEK